MGKPDPRRLVALLPWDSEALPLLESRSEPIAPLGIMWRINDLAGLLRQVQPELERRLAAAPPGSEGASAGLVLASDRDEVALEWSGSGLRIWPGPSPGSFPRCRLAQNDLMTLLLGSYASPEWLDGLGLPAEAWPRLARLFPPAGGVFWLTDNF